MPDMHTDTLARALGDVVREFRQNLDQHLEGVRMQAGAMVAEANARVAEAEARRDTAMAEFMMRVQDRLASIKDGSSGADGKDGAPGKDGDDGLHGKDGKDGLDGKDGAPGAEGPAGKDGADGRDGLDGAPGRDGLDGAPGSDGAVGADGAKGADGKDGKSVSVRGTFSEDDEYTDLDIVMMNGSSFIAIKENPGPCPGAGWQLLASRGSRGDRGVPGVEGKQGPRGDDGAPGDSPVALYVEGNEIIMTMSSGTELRAALPMVRR